MRDDLPLTITHEVRDRCLCLHLQRAARTIARRFDNAFRPLGLSNGQFSLLMALNRPAAPRMKDVAPVLAMDRTTLTATLKPLERRELVRVEQDADDRRSRRLHLTEAGRDLLVQALPIWRETMAEIEASLPTEGLAALHASLSTLSSTDT